MTLATSLAYLGTNAAQQAVVIVDHQGYLEVLAESFRKSEPTTAGLAR